MPLGEPLQPAVGEAQRAIASFFSFASPTNNEPSGPIPRTRTQAAASSVPQRETGREKCLLRKEEISKKLEKQACNDLSPRVDWL